MKEEEEAEKRAEDEGGGAEDEEAATGAQEENGDGPDEIELLFDGERPEVREWKSRWVRCNCAWVARRGGVLEVESEGEELVMEVEAEDEGGEGEDEQDAVVERERCGGRGGRRTCGRSRGRGASRRECR